MTEDEKRKLGFKRVFRMVVERGEEVREQRVPVHVTRAELALVIDALVAYEPNEEGAATAAATLRRVFEMFYDQVTGRGEGGRGNE